MDPSSPFDRLTGMFDMDTSVLLVPIGRSQSSDSASGNTSRIGVVIVVGASVSHSLVLEGNLFSEHGDLGIHLIDHMSILNGLWVLDVRNDSGLFSGRASMGGLLEFGNVQFLVGDLSLNGGALIVPVLGLTAFGNFRFESS